MFFIGGLIGLPTGAAIGLFTPVIMNDIYPKEWCDSYKNNGAILFLTCAGGVVGGTICGVIGGHNSSKNIRDYGCIGGLVGGAIGGLVGGTCAVYSHYCDDCNKQKI